MVQIDGSSLCNYHYFFHIIKKMTEEAVFMFLLSPDRHPGGDKSVMAPLLFLWIFNILLNSIFYCTRVARVFQKFMYFITWMEPECNECNIVYAVKHLVNLFEFSISKSTKMCKKIKTLKKLKEIIIVLNWKCRKIFTYLPVFEALHDAEPLFVILISR